MDAGTGARLHFLIVAESSLAEVGYCLHVAMRLGYITEQALTEFEGELNGVGAPLIGLIRSTRLMKCRDSAPNVAGRLRARALLLVTFLPFLP